MINSARLRRLRSRRAFIAVCTAAGAILAFALAGAPAGRADSGTGCDFAPNGSTFSCVGPLAGSTFAGGDGNLLANPTTYGTSDWENVAGLNTGIDNASGKGDNSFGQGTKEDDPNVTVVTGSIPPNKSDLTRFYEASEAVTGGDQFLYLGWERSNVLGSANMDFEIDQKATTFPTSGSVTLNRTAGDLLITFDFNNGGGRPVLSLNRWLTDATTPSVTGFSTNTCLSANSFPCWGDHVTLNGSDSEGAVNSDTVTDPFLAAGSQDLQALTFGETAIDLTKAGVFGTGTCTTFATTFLKSRASSSFPAEVKDFVAPIPTSISNCGEVKIIKQTDPPGVNQDFSYTSTLSGDCTVTSATSFTLNASGTDTQDCKNVPVGSYTVTEGAEPTGFSLESLTCTASGGGSGSQDQTDPMTADITVAGNSLVTCTYVNKQQLGAIKIIKTGKDKNCTAANTPTISNGVCTGAATARLSGATFTIKDSGGNAVTGSPATTGANGTVCVDGLVFSGTGTDYSVKETAAPTGYAIDNTAAVTVTVTQNSTCGDGNEAVTTFTDSPLTNISAHAQAQVSGATNTTITCTNNAGGADVGNSPQGPGDPETVTANGLKPGTYTCTIVVDP